MMKAGILKLEGETKEAFERLTVINGLFFTNTAVYETLV